MKKDPKPVLLVVGGLLVATVVGFALRHSSKHELIGVWKVEWAEAFGMPAGPAREIWIVERTQVTIINIHGSATFSLNVNATTDPKRFDLEGAPLGLGIYKLDGDTLRVTSAVGYEARPEAFANGSTDLEASTLLKRVDVPIPRHFAEREALLAKVFGEAPPAREVVTFDEAASESIDDLVRQPDFPSSELEAEIAVVRGLVADVSNGGFDQYFFNSAGDDSAETVEILKKVGATQTAKILEAARAVFAEGEPADDMWDRRDQLDEFTLDQRDRHQKLDEQFFARKEDLDLLMMKYWQSANQPRGRNAR